MELLRPLASSENSLQRGQSWTTLHRILPRKVYWWRCFVYFWSNIILTYPYFSAGNARWPPEKHNYWGDNLSSTWIRRCWSYTVSWECSFLYSFSRSILLFWAIFFRLNHVGDWGTQFGMLLAHLEDISESSDFEVKNLQELYKVSHLCVSVEDRTNWSSLQIQQSKIRFYSDEDFKVPLFHFLISSKIFTTSTLETCAGSCGAPTSWW